MARGLIREGDFMTVIVAKEVCTGCGICADVCPGIFELEGALAVIKVSPIPKREQTACRDAADSCPVCAIALDG